MIYELGKELQTTDFTDEHATEAMFSRLKQDLPLLVLLASCCFLDAVRRRCLEKIEE